MAEPTQVRWGLLATGWIAKTFAKDLVIDPRTRGVSDVVHRVTAVASSSSIQTARDFVAEIIEPTQPGICTAYGSYEDLVKDPTVDLVYVGTPHSHHYQHVMLCLTAGKAVVCEKPFTVNARQAKAIYQLAREKNLFVMEAMWTRCLPVTKEISQHVKENRIGEVIRVTADLCIGVEPAEVFPISHRMVNKDLAGGALLDLGIYPLSWVFQVLYQTLETPHRASPKLIGASMTFEPRTGVDELTTLLLDFSSTPTAKTRAQASISTGFRPSTKPSLRISGEKGEIQIDGPIWRPDSYKLIPHKQEFGEVIERKFSYEGMQGMVYEADEAGRCFSEGKLESDVVPWDENALIMEVMDQARAQAGLVYPVSIESTEYPYVSPEVA